MRIAIYGNSGSGKSTLAGWLAERAGMPVLDLDTIAWGETAVRRSHEASTALLREFVEKEDSSGWIIEGCYAELIDAALAWQPVLVFLNPGVAVCLDHCRARPWEPHKYATAEEQNERLAFLLDWVRAYDQRDDELSLAAHQRVFDGYAGEKIYLEKPVDLSAPPDSIERLFERVLRRDG